jgi:hypoxanthine phosphoribosyltransferase
MKKYIIIDRPGNWSKLSGLGINLIDFGRVVTQLREHIISLDPHHYQIILPGNSAMETWEQLNMPSSYDPLYVHAKRYSHDWVEGNPVVTVETLPIKLSKKIPVIIDDVISSGLTIKLVKERNKHLFHLASDIWQVFTPISRREKMTGFEIQYQELVRNIENKKPPLNSLSTLIDYPVIRSSYAQNYIDQKYRDSFLDIFD